MVSLTAEPGPRCPVCGEPVPPGEDGKVRTYWPPECRQRAYQARKAGKSLDGHYIDGRTREKARTEPQSPVPVTLPTRQELAERPIWPGRIEPGRAAPTVIRGEVIRDPVPAAVVAAPAAVGFVGHGRLGGAASAARAGQRVCEACVKEQRHGPDRKWAAAVARVQIPGEPVADLDLCTGHFAGAWQQYGEALCLIEWRPAAPRVLRLAWIEVRRRLSGQPSLIKGMARG